MVNYVVAATNADTHMAVLENVMNVTFRVLKEIQLIINPEDGDGEIVGMYVILANRPYLLKEGVYTQQGDNFIVHENGDQEYFSFNSEELSELVVLGYVLME